jgi:uncharacterized repeat protein (TIGR03803 family)
MRSQRMLLVFALTVCGAVLAACSRAMAPVPPGGLLQQTSAAAGNNAAAFRLLYSFTGKGGDGAEPFADLVGVDGVLYGTASAGGSSSACDGGCGTAFTVTTAGHEEAIYSFGSYAGDGTRPHSTLVAVGDTLYGTTQSGGSSKSCHGGCGTIFSLTKAGKERTLYSFGSYTHDGTSPTGGLTDVRGLLYGTTQKGGENDRGTIFTVTSAGKEQVRYSFGSYKHDGWYPGAPMTLVGNDLYGTTRDGGTSGAGTIFAITRAGSERLLHSFGEGSDGKNPVAGLVATYGALYGTTAAGGSHDAGAVFVTNLAGSEGVLHSFGGRSDGKDPQSGLILIGGTLYGTTLKGGAHAAGTAFSLATTGLEVVMHSFAGKDGAQPYAALTSVSGDLYGTTASGGSGTGCVISKSKGCGTVFTLGKAAP